MRWVGHGLKCLYFKSQLTSCPKFRHFLYLENVKALLAKNHKALMKYLLEDGESFFTLCSLRTITLPHKPGNPLSEHGASLGYPAAPSPGIARSPDIFSESTCTTSNVNHIECGILQPSRARSHSLRFVLASVDEIECSSWPSREITTSSRPMDITDIMV